MNAEATSEPGAGKRYTVVLDLLLLAVPLIALYHRALFEAMTLPAVFDTTSEFRPLLSFAGSCLVRGTLPLWNPYSLCGHPSFAMGYGMLFPLTALYGVVSFAAAAKIDYLLHLYLLGAGGYFFVRQFVKHQTAATFAGIILIGGGMGACLWNSGHMLPLRSIAYVPFIMLATWRLLNGGRSAWALLVAIIVATQAYGGNNEFLIFGLLGNAIFFCASCLFLIPSDKHRIASGVRAGLWLTAGVALGMALAAPQLGAGWELLRHESVRASGAHGDARVLERFGVSLQEMWNTIKWRRNYVGDIEYTRCGGWFMLGAVGWAMACFSLAGKHRRVSCVFLLVAAAAMLFAMGPNTPLYALLSRLPVIGQSRAPARIAYLITVLLASMAGLGFDRFLQLTGSGRLRTRHWLTLLLLAAFLLALPLATGNLSPGAAATSLLAFLITGSCLLYRNGPRWFAPLVFGIALTADLAFCPYIKPAMHSHKAHEVDRDFESFVHGVGGLDRVAIIEFGRRGMMGTTRNLGMLTGTRMFGGHAALPLRRFDHWRSILSQGLEGVSPYDGDLSSMDWLRPANVHLLDALGIRYVLSRGAVLEYPENDVRTGGGRFRKAKAGEYVVYENLKSRPVAYAVHQARVCSDPEQESTALLDPVFDPADQVILSSPFDLNRLAPAQGPETVQVSEYDTNRVDLTATMTAPGLVVLTDVFYPGWEATLDGQSQTEILCANGLFRAVFVPEGKHTIQFAFRPRSFRIGVVIAAFAGLVALCWAALLVLRRRGGDSVRPEDVLHAAG